MPDQESSSTSVNVLVVGVFDLFHRGHLELLKSARSMGDRLCVVVNGDEFVERYKRRPVTSEEDRAAIVEALKYVHSVEVSNSADIRPMIEKHAINLIVHGDDWPHESYMRQICVDEAYLKSVGAELAYLPYYEGVSTSGIISKIRHGEA